MNQAGEPVSPFDLRAMKFDLPWSSYRGGGVMTQHIETCRRPQFWDRLLDMLAGNGFNTLTLWNLHPFIYMFRPKGFEQACALPDQDLEHWQELHRHIFAAAHQRGIRTFLVFWNVFTGPEPDRSAFERLSGQEYHLGPPNLADWVGPYTRQCVKQVIDEYPDLDGLGFALGERMVGMSAHESVKWIEDWVIGGMRDASRPVEMLYRAPFGAGASLIRKSIERLDWPEKVYVEVKYNWSHGHSIPQLAMTHAVHQRGQTNACLWDPPPTAYRIAWTVRNEDFFALDWGEPDFVRAHIAENNHPYTGGYIIGSEGMIPAMEFACDSDQPRSWDYAFERQWLFWTVWGRLLADPDTPDAVFQAAFDSRYQPGLGEHMLQAWRLASRMPLRLASLYGATWDYTLYSEGFCSPFASSPSHDDATPLITVDELIDQPVLDPSFVGIAQFVQSGCPEDLDDGKVSPAQLAATSHAEARTVIEILDYLPESVANNQLAYDLEIVQLRAWGLLSLYLAAKIRAAIALARFRTGGQERHGMDAVKELQLAQGIWRDLSWMTDQQYPVMPYIDRAASDYRFDFHWANLLDDVRAETDRVRAEVILD